MADDGSVTLLLPNAFLRDNHLIGETAYEFPPPGSPLRLEAHLLAAHGGSMAKNGSSSLRQGKRRTLSPSVFGKVPVQVYDARSTGMISDLVKRLGRLDPADWSETSVAYRIVRGR